MGMHAIRALQSLSQQGHASDGSASSKPTTQDFMPLFQSQVSRHCPELHGTSKNEHQKNDTNVNT